MRYSRLLLFMAGIVSLLAGQPTRSTAQVASAATDGPWVATGTTAERSGPGPDFPILRMHRAGDTLAVRDCNGGWCAIGFLGHYSWVAEGEMTRGPLPVLAPKAPVLTPTPRRPRHPRRHTRAAPPPRAPTPSPTKPASRDSGHRGATPAPSPNPPVSLPTAAPGAPAPAVPGHVTPVAAPTAAPATPAPVAPAPVKVTPAPVKVTPKSGRGG